MEILIPISIAIYVIQLAVFAANITADIQYECSATRYISTKKQALAYIIPFGFLYAFYNYYKKLD